MNAKVKTRDEGILGGANNRMTSAVPDHFSGGFAEERDGIRLSPIRMRSPSELRIDLQHSAKFKPLEGEEYDRLKADIKERGILVPLIARKDGTLFAGHNRHRAAIEIGLSTVPVQYIEDTLTPEQEREFVVKDNLFRRQLTATERASLLFELYPDEMDTVSISKGKNKGVNQKISGETGISEKTIQRSRVLASAAKEIAASKGREPVAEDFEEAQEEINARRRRTDAEKNAAKAIQQIDEMLSDNDSFAYVVKRLLPILRKHKEKLQQ